MKQVLEEVKAIPGVVGGFVFNSRKGVAANNLPPVFKEAKLVNIGKMLSKMYLSGKTNFSDITEISLYYEESVVIIREAAPDLFLIVISDPSVNLNLLTMSLNLIMDDFNTLTELDMEPIQGAKTGSGAAPKKIVTAEEVLQSAPLGNDLNSMRAALAKVMGPMAKIIFTDALNEWLQSNMPSYAELGRLVAILEREINDSDKSAYYRELILPYLEPKT